MSDFATRRRVMVDTQVRPSDVTSFPVIQAMMAIPRELFVPNAMREAAYLGENMTIGGNRVILEPRTLSKMLNTLNVGPGDLVLDLGPGYGYSTAVLAHLAEAVVAVEPDEPLAREAEAALAEIEIDNATVQIGALIDGAPEHAPYDVIVLQGAVEHIPQGIADQLAEGGRIAALFLEGRLGVVYQGFKIDGRINWRYAFNASAPVLPGFGKAREFTL